MMTPRLQDALPLKVRTTLVITCAEEDAYDPAWWEMLRRHALVLRIGGGDVLADSVSLVAAALRAHPIERVIALGHLGCRARNHGRVELAPNTAAIAAFRRYAGVACSLVKRRARGELAPDEAGEKLDLLVRLANLEACPELHAVLSSGAVSVYAAVYQPATREVELFEGAGFRRLEQSEVGRLITGANSLPAKRVEADFASAVAAHAYNGAPALGVQPGAPSC
jgi:carbonic anhydrase